MSELEKIVITPHLTKMSWENRVTSEHLKQFDVRAPRYTSYPTAVEFHESITTEDYEARLGSRPRTDPVSVYVHLPFCKERCLFCGCHVIVSPDRTPARSYLQDLRRELELVASRLSRPRSLAQLHLGGGTPTYFAPEELSSLVSSIFEVFPPEDRAELAVEVDPRVTVNEHVDALGELGFNRLSLGVQDLDVRAQEAIGRVQSAEETLSLIERARLRGFDGINIDLIYGLPRQTLSSFDRTLGTVLEMGPDRSAVYSFAFVPGIRNQQRRIPEDTLPDRKTKFHLYALARKRFLESGFENIGMDHFARPDDELAKARKIGCLRRNFQGYTVLKCDTIIGLGVSAIGDVGGAYVQNHKKLSQYRDSLSRRRLPILRGILRTRDDEIRRTVIQELMCNSRVETRRIEERFGISFPDEFSLELDLLAEHESKGLVRLEDGLIQATQMTSPLEPLPR